MAIRRISFWIDRGDYESLKLIASEKGISISKLLVSLLKANDNQGIRSYSTTLSSNPILVNFKIPEEEYYQIVKISGAYRVNMSVYIRNLISDYVNFSYLKEKEDDYTKLISNGDLLIAYELLGSKIETLNPDLMYKYARVCLELGKVNESKNIVESHYRHNKKRTLATTSFDLIYAELCIIEGFFEKAELLLNLVIEDAVKYKEKYLAGHSYFLLSLIDTAKKDVLSGYSNLEKSIEFLDIFQNPIELAKSYLFMTDFLEYEERFEEAEKYYQKSEEIINLSGNTYYKGWYLGGKGFNEYMKGRADVAIKLGKLAISQDKKSGSMKQLRYSLSVVGKSYVTASNFDFAEKYLKKAVELENQMFSKTKITSSKQFLLYIKSKNNTDIRKEMAEMASSNKASGLTRYLYLTSQYLFGNKNETAKAEKGLQLLQSDADTKHLASTISNTLLTKSLCPVA